MYNFQSLKIIKNHTLYSHNLLWTSCKHHLSKDTLWCQNIMPLRIMTLSKKDLFVTLRINDNQYNGLICSIYSLIITVLSAVKDYLYVICIVIMPNLFAECWYSECPGAFFITRVNKTFKPASWNRALSCTRWLHQSKV